MRKRCFSGMRPAKKMMDGAMEGGLHERKGTGLMEERIPLR
jgi:hypothetical protein